MPRRLLALLSVACFCSAAVLAVGDARAGKGPTAAVSTPHRPQAPAVVTACRLPDGYRHEFKHASEASRLPLAMLVAVGQVESRLKQNARSGAGAQGVLQVLPSTATALGLDPSEPASNVLAGAVYLRQLLERFDSVDLALAAYNAGPSAVQRAGGAPSLQTLRYVANVTELWRSLLRCH